MSGHGKKGVLLVNLGTPDAPTRGAVYRYLKQFLLDPRVIDYPWLPRNLLVRGIIAPFRSGSSSKLYKMLWTEKGSPLKFYGEDVRDGVQEILGDDYIVELAMRYQNPSIGHAVQRLEEQQVSEIIVFPMFPQYASATTGSVHEAVMRELAGRQIIPDVKLINSYYNHPDMIRIFADNARQFDLDSYDHIIFSYHGLPQRQLRKGDPTGCHCTKVDNCCQQISSVNQFCYSAQCHGTTQAIAAELQLKTEQYTTAFQSRLGPEAWAQPYTIKVIEELAEQGAKRLLVFSPAFVADCLETIIEIGTEYQEEFEEMGGEHVDLVPSLNNDPRWIKIVADMVQAYA
ncbi:ferrochelatase [Phaeodactylibacter luteus]|uniref:Ferrochelatase n=1 Tax=Phaeodactylibacter luteus TaxID=1564516 RepID=A0A5C6RMG9_9BACT|nr:ferrochelatase [Phaeodactylibacter luteus]TXB63588.1 ferrochelatase [Phaeodactylibacter luteus]